MAATIKEIAIRAGGSEGTVDRALNNRSGISERTKEKVLAIAKELNYEPNHLASCLATGKTKTIGVVCADIGNQFFSSLIEEIERVAYENGYFINLILTRGNVDKELDGLRYFERRRVDGIIIFPIGAGKEYDAELNKIKVPIVTIYNKISDKYVYVGADFRQIMRNAVSFLVNKGYTKILYLEGYKIPKNVAPPGINVEVIRKGKQVTLNNYTMHERYKGYEEGIKDERLFGPLVYRLEQMDEMVEIIKDKNERVAVLCAYDKLAIRAMDVLRQRGIETPRDVGIMGFDNIEMLDLISPRLASVDCGIKEIGRKAFGILLREIEGGKNIENCITGYSFVEGESL